MVLGADPVEHVTERRPAGHLLRCHTSADRTGATAARGSKVPGRSRSLLKFVLRELSSRADQLWRLSERPRGANTWLRFRGGDYPQKVRLLEERGRAASSPTVILLASRPWTCSAVSRRSLPAGSRQDSAWAELFPPRTQTRVKRARLETFNRREPQRSSRAEPAPQQLQEPATSSPPWSSWKSPLGDVKQQQ